MSHAIAAFAVKVYSFLIPLAWIGVAVVIFILLPMACFRATRTKAGGGLYIASWLFGATTWFLGVAVTFATWGWFGLFIGLLLAGVGVVPMAILAAFISLKIVSLGVSLIVMCIIVFATRAGGIALMS